jgi:hypothetical protein
MKFEKGDIVRLRKGKLPLRVVTCYKITKRYDLMYLHSEDMKYYVPESNIVAYEEQPEQKENQMTQLYEFVDATTNTTKFGTQLATNSEGKWVMEVKGTGEVLVIPAKDAKKVMPYTIGVKFEQNGQEYHYLAEKGKYEQGQVFITNSLNGNYQIAVIHRINTESDKANKEFTPVARVLTEKV